LERKNIEDSLKGGGVSAAESEELMNVGEFDLVNADRKEITLLDHANGLSEVSTTQESD
jgi:hypothetical protein